VRNEEKVKLSVDDFRLLDKALVHIGSLGWIVNELLLGRARLLEESLANALVYDDKSHFRSFSFHILLLSLGRYCLLEETIFFTDDLV